MSDKTKTFLFQILLSKEKLWLQARENLYTLLAKINKYIFSIIDQIMQIMQETLEHQNQLTILTSTLPILNTSPKKYLLILIYVKLTNSQIQSTKTSSVQQILLFHHFCQQILCWQILINYMALVLEASLLGSFYKKSYY